MILFLVGVVGTGTPSLAAVGGGGAVEDEIEGIGGTRGGGGAGDAAVCRVIELRGWLLCVCCCCCCCCWDRIALVGVCNDAGGCGDVEESIQICNGVCGWNTDDDDDEGDAYS